MNRRPRRYYGEKMLADGTDAAYPPTPAEEQQWQDGVGYNMVPNGTRQYVDPAGNRGPVQTTYQKAVPPPMSGPGKSGQPKPLPTQRLMMDQVIHGTQPLRQLVGRQTATPQGNGETQPVQQLTRTVERVK